MSTYQGLFMRGNLNSKGEIPENGILCACPDIIPVNTKPIPDFQNVLATEQSYNKSYGNQLLLGYDNYIYVRGKNSTNSPITKKFALYYVPSQVINWPIKWYNNRLPSGKTAGSGNPNYFVTAKDVAPNAVGVGDDNFLWANVPPPPTGSHYCLVAKNYTPDPNNPNFNPVQRDYATTVTPIDMGKLVASDLSYGWLNMTMVTNNTPTITIQQQLTLPHYFKSETLVNVYIEQKGLTGCLAAFTCNTQEGSDGPIAIPPTKLDSKGENPGVKVRLKPGFTGTISLTYWSNGITPAVGSTLEVAAAYIPDETVSARTLEQVRLINHSKMKIFNHASQAFEADSPEINSIYLGGNNMTFKKPKP